MLNRCRALKLYPGFESLPHRQLSCSSHWTSRRRRSPSPNVSKTLYGRRLIEQSDRTVERRWTEVHVALRHPEFPMSGKLLDGPRRRAPHRQMRAERVTQDVHAVRRQPRPTGRPKHAAPKESEPQMRAPCRSATIATRAGRTCRDYPSRRLGTTPSGAPDERGAGLGKLR